MSFMFLFEPVKNARHWAIGIALLIYNKTLYSNMVTFRIETTFINTKKTLTE